MLSTLVRSSAWLKLPWLKTPSSESATCGKRSSREKNWLPWNWICSTSLRGPFAIEYAIVWEVGGVAGTGGGGGGTAALAAERLELLRVCAPEGAVEVTVAVTTAPK